MGKNIRKCRFIACKHKNKEIDIDNESFVKDGRCFYHQDCYELKKTNEWKSQKTRDDLTLFRDMWYQNISRTVNFSQLMKILNEYIARGIDSEYLVFALKYVIDHNMNLNYPNGFKYYVDRTDIKRAYEKHQTLKNRKMHDDYKPNISDDNSPTFNVKQKQTGFQSILKG